MSPEAHLVEEDVVAVALLEVAVPEGAPEQLVEDRGIIRESRTGQNRDFKRSGLGDPETDDFRPTCRCFSTWRWRCINSFPPLLSFSFSVPQSGISLFSSPSYHTFERLYLEPN
jgi:hypothetical protein